MQTVYVYKVAKDENGKYIWVKKGIFDSAQRQRLMKDAPFPLKLALSQNYDVSTVKLREAVGQGSKKADLHIYLVKSLGMMAGTWKSLAQISETPKFLRKLCCQKFWASVLKHLTTGTLR